MNDVQNNGNIETDNLQNPDIKKENQELKNDQKADNKNMFEDIKINKNSLKAMIRCILKANYKINKDYFLKQEKKKMQKEIEKKKKQAAAKKRHKTYLKHKKEKELEVKKKQELKEKKKLEKEKKLKLQKNKKNIHIKSDTDKIIKKPTIKQTKIKNKPKQKKKDEYHIKQTKNPFLIRLKDKLRNIEAKYSILKKTKKTEKFDVQIVEEKITRLKMKISHIENNEPDLDERII